ncbi:hypothetical protein B1813_10645 [Saccharomonospora piscinae]|uniref:Uncharacterized protein n=1 Tax=Saccharomonospora piscinae TaxID=687388 RepID=A0A1V9A659_SACPI|nr:hypothetical protein [Saccharomonospora piscinae]OQO92617.1 hypothetical protein B1813_10645 [Saccharomonospora piscinae]
MIKTITAEVDTDFNQFLLFDVESDLSFGDLPIPNHDIATSGDGGILCFTRQELAEANVTVRLWSGAVDIATTGDAPVYTGRFSCPTGTLMLASIMGSPADTKIELGRSGWFRTHITMSPTPLPMPEATPDFATAKQDWSVDIWPSES